MESLSKAFENAHGVRLKTAFAETLVHLLYSIGKVRYFVCCSVYLFQILCFLDSSSRSQQPAMGESD